MWIAAQAPPRIGNTNKIQQAFCLAQCRRTRCAPVIADRFGDLLAQRQHGVQRSCRLLEDHRDAAAADLAHLRFGQCEQIRGGPLASRKTALPLTSQLGAGGVSRMIARLVTLLPEPDSPTSASVSPRARLKETPFTAGTTPLSVLKRTRRSDTSSTGVAVIGCRAVDRAHREARRPGS